MTAQTAIISHKEDEIMTDYQFKTILKMVLEIAEKTDNIAEIKKALKELIYGEDDKTADMR